MKITGHRTVSVFQCYRIVSDDDVRAALERTEAAVKLAAPRNVIKLGRKQPALRGTKRDKRGVGESAGSFGGALIL
jgi:hypothetical protein